MIPNRKAYMDPSQDSMESMEWNPSQDSIQEDSIQDGLHNATFHCEDKKQV